MSETEDPPALAAPRTAPMLPHRMRGSRTVFVVLALIAVIGTLVYLLRDPARRQLARLQQPAPAVAAVEPAQVAALAAQVSQLQQRVTALEHKPAPSPASAAPALPLVTSAGTDPLVMALSGRMDGLNAQIVAVAGALKADEARLEAAGNQADAVSALTDRVGRLARLAAAAAALQSGLPLGDLPAMPPALARFRDTPPPIEPALRLAFPAVAAQARAAARPDIGQLGFWGAMRARAAALVTVRRGETVLVGSRAAGILEGARVALEAGDLAGAVRILGGLDGAAAAAVAGWRAEAQALLDARAALDKLASQA